MKVKVRLFGTLGRHLSGYQHSQGIEVEVPEGATVKHLLAHLQIPELPGTVVIMEGRVLNSDDRVCCGVPINVLQRIGGG
jgi:sulfur carrier protein ThiS